MRKVALLALALPTSLYAQAIPTGPYAQAVPPGTGPEADSVVVTATRVPTPVANIPAGVTVIDRATIEQRGYTDLVQALSAVPGLRVAQSGGPGSEASVFIRGTNSNHVLVLRDGVPLNDPSSPNDAFGFGDDTLNDIERIEIIRGPMSSLYGSGAIGGVINLITRRASAAQGGSQPATLHGSVTLAGGSQATGLARANAAGTAGIWDFATTLEGFSTRGFDQTPAREFAVYTGEADGDREKMATVEVGVTPVSGTRVSLELRGRDDKFGYDEQGFQTYDGGNATGADAEISGRLGVVSHLFNGAWTTALTLSRVQDDRRFTVSQTDLDPNGDYGDDRYHGRSNDAQWTNTVQLPDLGPASASALTFGYSHLNNSADVHTSDVYYAPPADVSEIHAHQDTDSGYAGVQSTFWQRLTATGQVREDAVTGQGSAFTWRFGGVLDVPEIDSKLHAAYGTGFRAPALYELYGINDDGPYTFTGNPNLHPERSTGWEAGVQTDVPVPQGFGSLSATAAYFDNRIHELIETAYLPPFYQASTLVNVDRARTHGVEAGLTLRVAAWLSAALSYTYTDARNLETGSLLLRRPENQGAADLRLTPFAGFSIVPEITYTGRFADYLVNDLGEDNGVVGLARSGLIVNLNLTWQVTPRVAVFIWGKNLGGSTFEPVSGYVTPGTSVLFGTKVGF
jgi:vitamin B12 transporter